MSEAVRLTIPRSRSYYAVARLVIGGLATRLDLSFEYLDDLQIALESVVANDAYGSGPDVTIELVVDDDRVELLVGPLDGDRVSAELEGEPSGRGEKLGLKRLLGTVVDAAAVERRDGAAWIRLRKPLPGRASA